MRSLEIPFLRSCLILAFATSCAADVQPTDAGSFPDAGTLSDAAVLADAGSVDPCGLELGAVEISEGGRLAVSLEEGLLETIIELQPSAGLDVQKTETGLEIWSDYGIEREQFVTIVRQQCPDASMSVAVRSLEWSTLAQWDPAAHGPPAREYAVSRVVELDGARGLLVLGGFHYLPRQFTPSNDLWFFDFSDGSWDELSSPDAPLAGGARVAEGPEPGTLFFHGGAQLAADGSLRTPPRLEIFNFGGGAMSWQTAEHASASPGSYTGAFFFDAQRNRWLSVCGADSSQLGVHCEVSEYTVDGGWTTLAIDGPAPDGRFGFHQAFDREGDRIVIAGGQGGGRDVLGDTWALELNTEPPRWVRLFESQPEVARRNGAYAFDPVGRRLFLWGGTADGRRPVPGLSVLRLAGGGERWDHLPMPEFVEPRASGLAAYDSETQRIVLGFGNASRLYTDLFELSL